MPYVNLYILEIDASKMPPYNDVMCDIGSSPREAGSVVEGLTVPPDKIWLFPIGGDYARIERHVKGERKNFRVKL